MRFVSFQRHADRSSSVSFALHGDVDAIVTVTLDGRLPAVRTDNRAAMIERAHEELLGVLIACQGRDLKVLA